MIAKTQDIVEQGISNNTAYKKALELLREAKTDQGYLASVSDVANYRRVFARDGVICGLAGCVSQEPDLIEGMKATLQTLYDHRGEVSQIPSNIKFDQDGQPEDVSYGGTAGRVDANLWFIIGTCQYALLTGDYQLADDMSSAMRECFHLLSVWEYNSKGLIYVPQSGDWADEFLFHGYSLNVQLLRIWALKSYALLFSDENMRYQAARLIHLIRVNYWPVKEEQADLHYYHNVAVNHYLDQYDEAKYFLPCLTPSGYYTQFDGFSNALAILLGIVTEKQRDLILDFGEHLSAENLLKMIPAFWPPITKADPEWRELQANYLHEFRNYPYQYHNGGTWPMVNGWWGLALKSVSKNHAAAILQAMNQFNRKGQSTDWEFHEYGNSQTGEPGGIQKCSWSAAAAIFLHNALLENDLIWI